MFLHFQEKIHLKTHWCYPLRDQCLHPATLMWKLVLKERQGGSLGDVTQDRTAATATAKGKEAAKQVPTKEQPSASW